jgi:drug/metabolite transporter (DMT)-like permease
MTPTTVSAQHLGIFYMLISAFCFALMGAVTKILGNSFDPVQLVFFRNVFGVLFISVSFFRRPLRQVGGKPGLLVFRGVIGTLALYALFYNVTQIKLGEAITYGQTSPIFIALFSYLLLRERLNAYAWVSIVTGFIGILFIFKPGVSDSIKTNSIGLFCGIGTALAYISIRELKQIYDTRAIVLSFMASGLILPLISVALGFYLNADTFDFLVAEFIWPQAQHWLWIILLGVTSLIGQVFLTRAYGAEKAGVVSAIGYTNIVFSTLLGTMLGDPLPDLSSIIGILLILSSGVVISLKKGV